MRIFGNEIINQTFSVAKSNADFLIEQKTRQFPMKQKIILTYEFRTGATATLVYQTTKRKTWTFFHQINCSFCSHICSFFRFFYLILFSRKCFRFFRNFPPELKVPLFMYFNFSGKFTFWTKKKTVLFRNFIRVHRSVVKNQLAKQFKNSAERYDWR